MLRQARGAVAECLDKVDEETLRRGNGALDPADEYDRSVLAFVLVGLMDRAQARGVPWTDITKDAEQIMRLLTAFHLIPPVQ